MTRSHPRIRRAVVGLAAALCLATAATAEHHEGAAGEHPHGHAAEVIEVVSTNVQGKNVFIPSTIVVPAGKPAKLSFFNTTDTPHGFSITGTDVSVVLPVKEEHEVELPALAKGIYRIHCHLHPPHRSAQLLVVDAE